MALGWRQLLAVHQEHPVHKCTSSSGSSKG